MEKYIVFDIDGTLNQTHLYAYEAYREALARRGLTASDEEIRSIIGMSPVDIAEHFLGPHTRGEYDRWVADITETQHKGMLKHSAAFEGMKETLQQLKAEGYKLAVCSNAFPDYIEFVLETIDLIEYFDEFISIEYGKTKAEALKAFLKMGKADKACMVGDRIYDYEAAKGNGIPLIGCAYGYAPEEIERADYVVNRPSGILYAVQYLL